MKSTLKIKKIHQLLFSTSTIDAFFFFFSCSFLIYYQPFSHTETELLGQTGGDSFT